MPSIRSVADIVAHHMGDTVALVVALLLALAVSGRFSVTASLDQIAPLRVGATRPRPQADCY